MAQSLNLQVNKVQSGITINYTLPSSEMKCLNNTDVGINANQVNDTHLNNSKVDGHSSLFKLGGAQTLGKPVLDDSPYTYTRSVRFRNNRREGENDDDSDDSSYSYSRRVRFRNNTRESVNGRVYDGRTERNRYARAENGLRHAEDNSNYTTTSPGTGNSSSGSDGTYFRHLPRYETARNTSHSRYDVFTGEYSGNTPRSSRHNIDPFAADQSASGRDNCNISHRSYHYKNPLDHLKTRDSASQTPYIAGLDRRDLIQNGHFFAASRFCPFPSEDNLSDHRPTDYKKSSNFQTRPTTSKVSPRSDLKRDDQEEFEHLKAKYNCFKSGTHYY